MQNAKEQLWQAYSSKSIRPEGLFAGLKLIESKFTSVRGLRDNEINIIIEIANDNIGLVTGDKKHLCLHKRGKYSR